MATRLPDATTLGARPVPQSGRQIVSIDGGAVGRAVQGLGATLTQLGEAQQKELDAQAVFEAKRKLDEWERSAVFDPESGAASKRGRDAFDLPERLPQEFDKAAGEIGQGLSTQRQRMAFQEVAAQRRNSLAGWADRYAQQQRTVFEQGQYEADIASAADRAALYATDPATVGAELQAMRARTIGFLRGRGASEEEIQQALLNNATALHGQVAQTLLRTDPMAAKQYLDQNKASIDPVQFNRLSSVADDAAMDFDAKQRADSIAMLPFDQQLAEVAKLTDPKLREKTRLFVRQNQADIAAARAEQERQASDQVWQLIANGTSLSRLPPDVLAQMNGRERVAVNQHFEAEAKRRKAEAEGRAVKTDMATLEKLYSMPRDEFLSLRISTLSDRLSRSDMEEMIKRQAAMRDPAKAPQIATADQQVGTRVLEMELKGKNKGLFQRAAHDAFNAFTTATGRAPTYEERQKLLDQVTMEVSVPGFLWDSDKPAFKLTPEDREKLQRREAEKAQSPKAVPVPMTQVINGSDRNLITQALRAEGIPVTEENIQRRYFEARGGR
jgi:hypothetical protein